MKTLRILGGQVKGLRLKTPPNLDARPMIARVREALFAMLAPEIQDQNILDLFAGTGAMGIEALSRGARYVTFVEQRTALVAIIRHNLQRAHFTSQGTVIRANVFHPEVYQPHVATPRVVFLDPPYRHFDDPCLKVRFVEFLAKLVDQLALHTSLLVLHYRRGCLDGFPWPPPLELVEQRTYGTTEIALLCVRPSHGPPERDGDPTAN